jgi:hypothetical protein
VPDGFILSAINIAVANRFFTRDKPNRNINTMQPDELAAALRKNGVRIAVDDLAKSIVRVRNLSNGFSDMQDLVEKFGKHTDAIADAEVKQIEKRYQASPRPVAEKQQPAAEEIARVRLDARQDKQRLDDNHDKVAASVDFAYVLR